MVVWFAPTLWLSGYRAFFAVFQQRLDEAQIFKKHIFIYQSLQEIVFLSCVTAVSAAPVGGSHQSVLPDDAVKPIICYDVDNFLPQIHQRSFHLHQFAMSVISTVTVFYLIKLKGFCYLRTNTGFFEQIRHL